MDVIKKEGEPFPYQPWPSWATGPNGENAIFNSEAEVPEGWTHHETVKGKAKPATPAAAKEPVQDPAKAPAGDAATPPTPPAPPAPPAAAPNSAPAKAKPAAPQPTGDVDAAGVKFDPARHAATKSVTKAGLWRMKVGVSRPESESTPKALDL